MIVDDQLDIWEENLSAGFVDLVVVGSAISSLLLSVPDVARQVCR